MASSQNGTDGASRLSGFLTEKVKGPTDRVAARLTYESIPE
jgi:hypothetical protein